MSIAQTYQATIVPSLLKELNIENVQAVPRIQKIVVNAGVGKYLAADKKDPSGVVEALKRITGQNPVVNAAKKSVSNFKLREGMPVGVSVTLRKQSMYDFLERIITFVAPRIRDFRGFPNKSFDGRGNYSFGISEHTVFPEIPQDDIVKPFGLQITIVSTAENDEALKKLLTAFQFPFKK